VQIYAYNAPRYIWQPGSARTHWGSLCTPPDPLATMGAYLYGEGRKGRGPTSRWTEGRKGRREGREFPPKSE